MSAAPETTTGGTQVQTKAGRHREATLYHALAGQGAGADGVSLAQHRERAQAIMASTELPVWRRSGFWTTTFEDLGLDSLTVARHPRGEAIPDAARRVLRGGQGTRTGAPEGGEEEAGEVAHAGRIVQLDGSVVSIELDEGLREKGVILCTLEEAAEAHSELFERWYTRRLTYDRNRLEAANAALWTDGVFLYVPEGLVVEGPFEIVYAIGQPGTVQYGRTLIVGGPSSDFKVHEYEVGEDFQDSPEGERQALHVGAFELYLQDNARCRVAQFQDWGTGEVHDLSTRFVGVGRDAYCHWLPALLGGHLVRHHLELAVCEPGGDMAFRGLFFAESDEHLDVFAVDLHETGPSGGDVHWRGAATGAARASFEGLIQIDPGAQQTHTYLQIHTMMLSPRARLDAIPSVLVSADDVSASHGGTVGELDEDVIYYMQSRGLDRPTAVRVIVEGFFEPLLSELADVHLQELIRERVSTKLAAAREDIEAYATTR